MSKEDDIQFYVEEIYKHYDYVLNYLLAKTRDPELAKDLTQEAMVKAWLKVKVLKEYNNVSAGLIAIAKNTLNDHYRKKKNTFATLTSDDTISEVAEPSNILVHFREETVMAELTRIFDQLSDDEVKVILLYDAFDRSMIEVSRVMNLNYSTAVSRRKRALKKAKKIATELDLFHEALLDEGY